MKRYIQNWLLIGVVTPFFILGTAHAQEATTPSVVLPPVTGPVTQPQAPTPPKATPKARLEFMFSGYHFFPKKADLADLGSDAEVALLLREMAEDPSSRVTTRTKAIDALGYYTDADTVDFLKHLVALNPEQVDPKLKRSSRSMRHHAIMSIAKSQEDKSIEILEVALNDPDIQIRKSAISAIGKHAGKAGKSRLTQLGKTEENPYVRREIRKYVKL